MGLNLNLSLGLSFLLLSFSVLSLPSPMVDSRPNIIFIYADDLGYGDLSSYGASDIATPNIDSLAEEGMKFTNFYTASNVCSPSRAALMTGRYPMRSGVNSVLFADTMEGLPLSEVTLAEVLRDAGYATGMVGKWHLGHTAAYMPMRQGFEYFFGVPYSNDDYNFFMYEGENRLPEPIDQHFLIQRYTDKALHFIETQVIEQRSSETEKPFFLYFAHNAPHVPLYASPKFEGSSNRGIFGDVVQEMDWSVGQVLKKLQELSIDDNTLVIFSSDNGPWIAMREYGGDAGGLRDGKMTAFEGGHRVPALVRWPGKIPAGGVEHKVANMMDWLPTFAALAQIEIPKDRVIDGQNITAVLLGEGARESDPFFYYQLSVPHLDPSVKAKLGGVRMGKWKLKLPRKGNYPSFVEPIMKMGLYKHGLLLFNLEDDPFEKNNLVDDYPKKVLELQALIDNFEKNNIPTTPVRAERLEEDHGGWKTMYQGVFVLGGVVFVLLVIGIIIVVNVLRHLLRR